MVTVRDVLAVEALSLVPLHVADARADVRWVATSELADPTPYLEGGEVLLTTGLGTSGWRSEWTAYVDRLVVARVAALGLGVGLTHRRAPVSLVRACREAGLTLVQVPRPTSFVAVSRATVRLLERDEQAAVRDALQVQRLLTRAALRDDGTEALLDRLADVLVGETCLLAPDGSVVAGRGHGRPGLEADVLAAELARIRPQGLRTAASASRSTGTTVLQPVGLRGRPSSYLAVSASGRLSEGQRSAVGTTVALLSLAAERANDRRATERELRGRAVQLLAAGEPRAAELVLGALVGGGGTAGLPRSLRVVRGAGEEDALEDGLRHVEATRSVAALVDGDLWVLASVASAGGVARALLERGLRVGVGAATSPDDGGRAATTAAYALAQTTDQSRLVEWDRAMASGALSLLGPDRAQDFAASFLGGLTGPAEPELLETLGSFLRHLGSRQHVAEELGVHRNTVRNRVAQLEDALGGSLDDAQLRADAWIALQARGLTDAGAPPRRRGR